MNIDSNRSIKPLTPLCLKTKAENLTTNIRVAFTPITNTNYLIPKKKTFQANENLFKPKEKPLNINVRNLFTVRPKAPAADSPKKSLSDITNSQIENYELGKVLGRGAYATVRICTRICDKTIFAVKSYEKFKLREPYRLKNIRREIEIMKKIDHENVVKMIEAVKSDKHIHIVQEYFIGCSLGNFLKTRVSKKLQESQARLIFKQILSAVDYLHENGISHRDIKLENILIDTKFRIKLIDFGFSSEDEGKSRVFCGTPSYMALEIVNRREYMPKPADIWALGVVLHVMLTGTFPFRGISDKDLYAKINEGVNNIQENIPALAKRVILRMLSRNPDKRPTAKDLINDPWVSDSSSAQVQVPFMCRSPSNEY